MFAPELDDQPELCRAGPRIHKPLENGDGLASTGVQGPNPRQRGRPAHKHFAGRVRREVLFMLKTLFAAAAMTAVMAASALAADDKPAVVFDIGGKFDKSFNEGIYNGAEKFKAETGIAYGEFE